MAESEAVRADLAGDKVVFLAILGGSVGVGLGGPLFCLLPAIFASTWRVLGARGPVAENAPLDLVVGPLEEALEEADAIAAHIVSSTELGVLGASGAASSICAHLRGHAEAQAELRRLLVDTSIGTIAQEIRQLRSALDATQGDALGPLLSQSEACWAQVETAVNECCDAMNTESATMQQHAAQILVELQFQDKVRQELERMQQRTRAPLDAWRSLALEIGDGLPPGMWHQRYDELATQAHQEGRGETTHELCAGEDDVTGEFEMF